MAKILILDDEISNNSSTAKTLSRMLSALGHEIVETDRTESALQKCREERVELVFSDQNLFVPETGNAFANMARCEFPGIKLIRMSGRDNPVSNAFNASAQKIELTVRFVKNLIEEVISGARDDSKPLASGNVLAINPISTGIDDDFATTVECSGYIVTEASSLQNGIDIMSKLPEGHFSAIVLHENSLNLPGKDAALAAKLSAKAPIIGVQKDSSAQPTPGIFSGAVSYSQQKIPLSDAIRNAIDTAMLMLSNPALGRQAFNPSGAGAPIGNRSLKLSPMPLLHLFP